MAKLGGTGDVQVADANVQEVANKVLERLSLAADCNAATNHA